jgi:hypothetical protein
MPERNDYAILANPGWDGQLYADEAVHDLELPGEGKRSKRGKLHLMAVGLGMYLETEKVRELTGKYRLLDWTGLCFFNDMNNHGANSPKKNENGRLTGYWKILGTLSSGLLIRLADVLKKNNIQPDNVWVCSQTYKYMIVAGMYKQIGLRPVVTYSNETANGDEEEMKIAAESNAKKQRIGKLTRCILERLDADSWFGADAIKKITAGKVFEMSRGEFIDTTPFWDFTMSDQQLEKYIYGLGELYSRNPKLI